LLIAAIVSVKVFCVHGGISPELRSFNDIRDRERPQEIQDSGPFADLLWADPNPVRDADTFDTNERGTGVVFSLDAVREFLKENALQLIVRAHQVVRGGYEYSFPESREFVTVFSAPNYMGQFGNKGAVMVLDGKAVPGFVQFVPVRREGEPRPTLPGVKTYKVKRW
jgi:serine/threonine-protein phosphatase PP1 catalytic subunit